MMRFSIDDEDSGQRLDKVLAHRSGISRSRAAGLFRSGAVTVDGRPATHRDLVRPGQVVEAEIEEEERGDLLAQPVEFGVVFEDGEVAVIDKPVGIAVHPGAGRPDLTVANGVIHRWPEAAGVGEPFRPGIVHRLDAETSGLMVVALTPETHSRLVDAIRDRSVTREYLALISGVPRPPAGTVDAPIGRDPKRRTRMALVAGGRPARTHYEVVASWSQGVALVRVLLETGRTHQIRVHLAGIGHPVVGDAQYGGPRTVPGVDTPPSRPFLHASRLAFEHPTSGRSLAFSVSPPEDFTATIEALGSPADGEVESALVGEKSSGGRSADSTTRAETR